MYKVVDADDGSVRLSLLLMDDFLGRLGVG